MAMISSGRARRKNRLSLRQYNSKAAFSKINGMTKENTLRGDPYPRQIFFCLNLAINLSLKHKSTNLTADPSSRLVIHTLRTPSPPLKKKGKKLREEEEILICEGGANHYAD
jgi:hypothetical protein